MLLYLTATELISSSRPVAFSVFLDIVGISTIDSVPHTRNPGSSLKIFTTPQKKNKNKIKNKKTFSKNLYNLSQPVNHHCLILPANLLFTSVSCLFYLLSRALSWQWSPFLQSWIPSVSHVFWCMVKFHNLLPCVGNLLGFTIAYRMRGRP